MNRLFIVLLIGMMPYTFCHAQTITVTQFNLAETDLTANSKRTEVFDQNGDRCALIRVQTTQKGFVFDVGSAGVQKVDDSHTGEIWVYVPYGVRHISIRHKDLGSLPNYDFPVAIQKAKTYIMSITSDKVLVAKYDDTRKQKLRIKSSYENTTFVLNGVNIQLNPSGEATQELAFGTHAYRVEVPAFYPKEGQITIEDPDNEQTLLISDLSPIKGKLSVYVSPMVSAITIDGKRITQNTSLTPIELQIGKHTVTVSASGYRTETREVEVSEDKTTDVKFTLSRVADFRFNSHPMGAMLYINREPLGKTPCSKRLTTGTYTMKATKKGHKDFIKEMELSSSTPEINLRLTKINNYKNEFYIEADFKAGTLTAVGATMGGYINNVNVEASYFYGLGKSETIYWSGNGVEPISSEYSPSMNIVGKVGYGFPLGTRFRLTPQAGFSFLKLKETVEAYKNHIGDGANVGSMVVGLRFSAAIASHFAFSLTPEYGIGIMKSKGYSTLSEVSPTIKKWGNGFNVKLGVTTFF